MQGSQYDNVHMHVGRYKGKCNLLYTGSTRAIQRFKISGLDLDDGGVDLLDKMTLHAKSILLEEALHPGTYAPERVEDAKVQVAQMDL